MEMFDKETIEIQPLPECCVCLDTYLNDDHKDDLCSNKHPVCSTCLPKVDKCPMCREQLKEPEVPDEQSPPISSSGSESDIDIQDDIEEQILDMIDAINNVLTRERDHTNI